MRGIEKVNGIEILLAIIRSQIPSATALRNIITLKRHLQTIPEPLASILQQYESPDKQELLELIFERVAERYPNLLDENPGLPDFRSFIDKVLKGNKTLMKSVLVWDIKSNHALPLTAKTISTITELWEKLKDNKLAQARLRIALQTHGDLKEIEMAIQTVGLKEDLPAKESFFKLAPKVQADWLRRAQVFRDREALPLANKIVKDASEGNKAYNVSLLHQSLKVLEKTEVEGSKNSIDRLLKLIQSNSLDPVTKALACRALAKIEPEPASPERKKQLVAALQKTTDKGVRVAIVDCLGQYNFDPNKDAEVIASLIQWSDSAKDDSLKRSLAFTLSVIPDQRALEKALLIVESAVWDVFEAKGKQQDRYGKVGDYEMFIYRPPFHDNRRNMKQVIAERLVLLARQSRGTEIQTKLGEYKKSPDTHIKLKALEKQLRAIEDGTRYVPFKIFLPEDKCLFRGMNAKKGEKLGEASLNDLLLKGTGSADLWLYDTYENATWAKVGQVFSSSTLDYVMQGYFDATGVMMMINTKAINEAQLRREIRYQKEGSLHAVSYKKLGLHALDRIFLSKALRQGQIEALATGAVTEKIPLGTHNVSALASSEGKPKTTEKIARRQLSRPVLEGKPLKDRIRYFDEKNNLTDEIKKLMKEEGLSEMSIDDLVKENLERQAAREILAENLESGTLKKCMQEVLEM